MDPDIDPCVWVLFARGINLSPFVYMLSKILGDKQRLDNAIRVLVYQAEKIKLERQELRELKILLSKGEKNDKAKI